MKVVKFGGTSLASAAQIKKAVEIIKADDQRQAVVLSAPGKRDSQDIKITDLLINTHKLRSAGEDYLPTFTQIRSRFVELVELLEVTVDIEVELDNIQQKIEAGTTLDYVESRGEYLNGLIISKVLDAEFVDAADVVRLTADGRVDPESYELIGKRLSKASGRFVVPGFLVPARMVKSNPSRAAAPTSPAPSLPAVSGPMSMRTGPTFQEFSRRTLVSSPKRNRSRKSLTAKSANWHHAGPVSSTKKQLPRFATPASRSTSKTPMPRQTAAQ